MKRRTRLDTGKKFFLNKVSKYQPIIFSRLEWTDRQTNSVSKGKKKVSEKCQESVSKYHVAATRDAGRSVRNCLLDRKRLIMWA